MRTVALSPVLNYAVAQQDALRKRHYVLQSTHPQRWVAFAPARVASYQMRYGDNFCLIISGDPLTPGDFYAIPWPDASAHFIQNNMYPAPHKNGRSSLRWQIYIKDLKGRPHEFQFDLAPTDLRPRPRFDATRWYGSYAALGVPDESVDDLILADLLAEDTTFPEGRKMAVLHYRRERNTLLVQQAKKRFLAKHGRLYCEVCDFDFPALYGSLGEGFIEAHHSVPLRTLMERAETRIEDLQMVCANCHRMLHRGDQWLTVAELRELVRLTKDEACHSGRTDDIRLNQSQS